MPSTHLKLNKLIAFVEGIKTKFGSDLLVLTLYTLLTLILLYPFSILNMNSQLIGDGGDSFQGLWNLWWVKHSIFSFTNPYVTNYIFYPIGTDLYVHSLSPLAGFFTIPFQFAYGTVFSYNLLVILSFVLAGYGAYRLTYYFTADKKASFFAGLVFGFSTYHLARGWGHLNLVTIQWIPFYVLFLFKMRNETSLRNVFFSVFFLVLTALMADLQYIAFLGLFTLMLVVYDVLSKRAKIENFLVRLGIMTALFIGLMALIIGPFFYGMLTGKYAYATPSPNDSILMSADLLGFFVPSSLNLFFGRYSQNIISHFSTPGIESVVYIGYTVLALTSFAAIKLWKKVKFWLFGAFVFLILSLGPVLHILGVSSFTFLHITIPLPESLMLSVVPIFRVPSRFILMVMLILAVTSAITIKHLNAWFIKLKRGHIMGVLFLVLISVAFLAEVNMLPYPISEDVTVPKFYADLARMNETFAVLDLPYNYHANNRYMYYSTVSEKPLIGGSISRIPPANTEFLQVFPVINQMEYVGGDREAVNWKDIFLQDVNVSNLNSFYFFNVRYVILHRDMLNEMAFGHMNAYLHGLLGQPVYSDDRIVAYSTNATQLRSTFTFLSNGWFDIEDRDGTVIRWMNGNGTIEIIPLSAQRYNINFSAGTYVTDKELDIFLNGEFISNYQLFTNRTSDISFSVLLKEGVNSLSLYSKNSFIPADVNPNSVDTRCLSVYVQNVEVLTA